MAEASQKTNKPMTTADFIQRLGGAGSVDQKAEPSTVEIKKEGEKKKDCSENKSLAEVMSKKEKHGANSMEHLSDSDLQTLLQNFKDLSTEEQHSLINYLKTLEAQEPERVEKLRKFVSLGAPLENGAEIARKEVEEPKSEAEVEKKERPPSPFSEREAVGVNPDVEDKSVQEALGSEEVPDEKSSEKNDATAMETIDSDDEDYSFEDVVKAASKNIEKNEQEKKTADDESLSTQAIITNLLSSFSKSNNESNSNTTAVSSADFTRTLNSLPINMDSLANIVGNVKSMQASQRKDSNASKIDIFEDDSSGSAPAPLKKPPIDLSELTKPDPGSSRPLDRPPAFTSFDIGTLNPDPTSSPGFASVRGNFAADISGN